MNIKCSQTKKKEGSGSGEGNQDCKMVIFAHANEKLITTQLAV